MIASFQCDAVQVTVTDTTGSNAAQAVLIVPTNQTTNVQLATTANTISLSGQNILGHGPFLYLTVNGTPYKVQLQLT